MGKLDAILVLEDGRTFRGRGFGAEGEAFGEVVFNTSMTGYQEISSDPSYCGQIVTFTAPQIGNYGACDFDNQAARPAMSGIVVREISPVYSNWRAQGDFCEWLKRWGLVGITEVDTRALTRHLREHGSMRGGIWTQPPGGLDPVTEVCKSPSLEGANLTPQVTTKEPYTFPPEGEERHRVVLIDFGVKRGILRSLAKRGITVEVLPATAPPDAVMRHKPDGLVLSNGPGDPAAVDCGIETARALIGRLPILGICLGHQILGLALGAKTLKLRFGHHGGNHPVKDEKTGEVWITAQNHGFAVDPKTLPTDDLEVTHNSLYDGTLEGFVSNKRNVLAVQFHPEACPGPSDAGGVFDRFVAMMESGGWMPRRDDIQKILVIGSGPIVIGQACEFDYSGTQAARALKEEGYQVVLVNSNPATIMTDPEIADRTYVEPLTVSAISKIIERERPDALLPTVGGQTGLNMSVKLAEAGILRESGTRLIGARLETIRVAEDRRLFRSAMVAEGLDVPQSFLASSVDAAVVQVQEIGYPVVVRPSFTLGGEGGGVAYNVEELRTAVAHGIEASPIGEVLVEEGVIGWKEFELEVMRDCRDRFVVICSIENIDPMGVHTGDSVTVAPAMTLSDVEYQNMRDLARRVISRVGVETGGSNIQFAVNPENGRIVVIEMNPRVSRSSALASKATGFPIAKIAAKLAVGLTLDEIQNDITKVTPASFEPSLDYVVVKVPRFTFKKFPGSVDTLDTQMRSVGEVMSIGRTFQQALQKALRSLEVGRAGLGADGKDWIDPDRIRENLTRAHPARLFWVRGALKAGMSVEELYEMSRIDPWFLHQIQGLLEIEKDIRSAEKPLPAELLRAAKRAGYSDIQLAHLTSSTEGEVAAHRRSLDIVPTYKTVDTCAAEFAAETPYYYATYEDECEVAESDGDKVMILGGGPNRIGQGIEFDCCCVQAVMALREDGFETIMVNCNPETVSTDYDISDRLYFEPLTVEDVLGIVHKEKPRGVIVQFGGATPLSLAGPLSEAGVTILGTSPEAIDLAEDRGRFGSLLDRLGIARPDYGTARDLDEARKVAHRIGYPVLVRPSYVLGGQAMAVCYDDSRLGQYLTEAVKVSEGRAILVDKFLEDAFEVDVDALADGKDVVVCGIMQHLEQAGIHSGDSTAVLPTWKVADKHLETIRRHTMNLALDLQVKGLMNVQYAIFEDQVYVLEVNPRASRTVPFLSKACGIPFAKLAARIMLGSTLADLRLTEEPRPDGYAIKVPVFPFGRFPGFNPVLSPEMRSTGEAYGADKEFGLAFAKGMMSAYQTLPVHGTVCISVNNHDKEEVLTIARDFAELGFSLMATKGTAEYLQAEGLSVQMVFKVNEGRPHIADRVHNNEVDILINTPLGGPSFYDEHALRRAAIEHRVPIISTLSAAHAAVEGIRRLRDNVLTVRALQE